MTVTVKFFAKWREIAGSDRLVVSLPTDATVGELRQFLAEKFPAGTALLERCAIAVHQEFAGESRVLADSDEVAIIPPVSGG